MTDCFVEADVELRFQGESWRGSCEQRFAGSRLLSRSHEVGVMKTEDGFSEEPGWGAETLHHSVPDSRLLRSVMTKESGKHSPQWPADRLEQRLQVDRAEQCGSEVRILSSVTLMEDGRTEGAFLLGPGEERVVFW